ncbi:MAG: toll/interleukin-1 receptor domain-containing protein [Acidobacteriia bacterium]|nr:toll/interleukin-1 receptor domain-containing protein [Terriglobia bacterium]
MANLEHLQILKGSVRIRKGPFGGESFPYFVKAWNQWREENPGIEPNLSEANLSGANLVAANLSKTDLSRALLSGDLRSLNLTGANLRGADLSGDLRGANLSRADLSGANLSHGNFSGADLSHSNLSRVNLSGSTLIGAIFDNARVEYTHFENVDLSNVKGIETTKHSGPSVIDIKTIYLSKGKIPAIFLRGAGVPDNFIVFMSSLVGASFEFYSCFISYSFKDQEFADRLFADLQTNGVRCWFAQHDMQAGKTVHEQIDTAIRLHERLLLIVSSASINSEWVKTEIAKARKREIKERKRVLFPIRLNISFDQLQEWECFDADRGKDSAREIREYYIPDFTGWKNHDKYQQEFKKLLRDLKKETTIAGAAEASGHELDE